MTLIKVIYRHITFKAFKARQEVVCTVAITYFVFFFIYIFVVKIFVTLQHKFCTKFDRTVYKRPTKVKPRKKQENNKNSIYFQ